MIIKNTRKTRFIIINAEVVANKQLSLKSLGLLTMLLSLPENWKVRVDVLSKRFTKEGSFAIRSALKELIDAGYVKAIAERNKQGQILSRDYVVSDCLNEISNFTEPSDAAKNLACVSASQSGTAAVETNRKQSNHNNPKMHDESTAVSLTECDGTIKETLTRNQILFIEREVRQTLLKKSNTDNFEQFVNVLKFVMTSSKHFNRAHPNFIKKFNAIAKVITQGRWVTPPEYFQEKQKVAACKAEPYKKEIRTWSMEEQHWKKLLAMDATKNNPTLHKNVVEQLKTAQSKKIEAIAQYEAAIPTQVEEISHVKS